MTLKADLHTHTVASGHAYSTVTENARVAAERGLQLIACTDHAPACPGGAHAFHFWNLSSLPCEIEGVKVMAGVEADIVGPDGELDLPAEVLAGLDFVIAGFHLGCGFDDAPAEANTRALLGAISNPLVDMVSHPGNDAYPVDAAALIAAAVKHGVILEMNNLTYVPGGSREGSDAADLSFIKAARDAGALLALSSDAHFHEHVGRFEPALSRAREAGMAETDFINSDPARLLEHLLARRERPRIAHWLGTFREAARP